MLISVFTLLIGVILLIWGADTLVKGASRLALGMGISPLVVGLTIVAYGTGAPELSVSSMAAIRNEAGLTIGNVVGSNIFNILMALGITSLIRRLPVAKQLRFLDFPALLGLSLLTLFFFDDSTLSYWEGQVFLTIVALYTLLLFALSKKTPEIVKSTEIEELSNEESDEGNTPKNWKNLLFIAIGVIALLFGSDQFVESSVDIATYFGVDPLLIGLTVVSIGTSLPELITTVVAALRKESDIAIGNAIGSCFFNIAAVLGFSSVLGDGIEIPLQVKNFDQYAMIACVLLCFPAFYGKKSLKALDGVLFVSLYLIYSFYIVALETDFIKVQHIETIAFSVGAPLIAAYVLWHAVIAFSPVKNSHS